MYQNHYRKYLACNRKENSSINTSAKISKAKVMQHCTEGLKQTKKNYNKKNKEKQKQKT